MRRIPSQMLQNLSSSATILEWTSLPQCLATTVSVKNAKLHASHIKNNQSHVIGNLTVHKWDANSFLRVHYNKPIISELLNYAVSKSWIALNFFFQ